MLDPPGLRNHLLMLADTDSEKTKWVVALNELHRILKRNKLPNRAVSHHKKKDSQYLKNWVLFLTQRTLYTKTLTCAQKRSIPLLFLHLWPSRLKTDVDRVCSCNPRRRSSSAKKFLTTRSR